MKVNRRMLNGMVLVIGAGYGSGGRSLVDDVERDTHISTLRPGLDIVFYLGIILQIFT
jgi:hypothetical protein